MIKLKDILLNEQFPSMNFQYPSAQAATSIKTSISPILKDTMQWIKKNDHLLIDISALIASAIPGGMPMAVGLELANAALYFQKGDKLMGTLSTVFAALPIIGSIPGVKQVTSSFIKGIKKSINDGVKLTNDQLKYISQIIKVVTPKIKTKINDIKKLINGIDKAAVDKANRMLQQKLKMVGDVNDIEKMTKIYQEYIDGLQKVKYRKDIMKGGQGGSGAKLGKGGPSGGTMVFSNASSKGKKLTAKQKQYIVRHEMDHIYRNTPEEAADWIKAFDKDKIGSSYFAGSQPLPNQTGFALKKYNTWDELRARAGQLKDFIAIEKGIPLSKDFKINMIDLDHGLKNYLNKVGFDNSMSKFIASINDKDHLLKLMNKYAL